MTCLVTPLDAFRGGVLVSAVQAELASATLGRLVGDCEAQTEMAASPWPAWDDRSKGIMGVHSS